MKDVEREMRWFTDMGGKFILPIEEMVKKAHLLRGFIFDWDGVFHAGQKGEREIGVFSEADSMGTNMLRYGYWRRYEQLPFMAIISGEQDKAALKLAQREHFNAIYTGIRDKKQALDRVCTETGMEPQQIACFFDDINDISMVKYCGLRFQIRRTASPLFISYSVQKGWCDYITAHPPAENAVRECCELLLGLWGNYLETIQSRAAYDNTYQAYWNARNETVTGHFSKEQLQNPVTPSSTDK